MNGNLSQQPRQDKNGKITKRWVRDNPSQPVSHALTNVPPPSPSSFDMNAFMDSFSRITKMKVTRDDFSSYSLEALERLSDMFPKISTNLFSRSTLTSWIGAYGGGDDEEIFAVSEYERMDEGVPLEFTLYAVRGLPYYGARELNDAQTRALIDVAYPIARDLQKNAQSTLRHAIDPMGYGNHRYWISDDKLVDCIVNRTDDIDKILHIIEHRETVDPEVIESILGSGVHGSLIEGVL